MAVATRSSHQFVQVQARIDNVNPNIRFLHAYANLPHQTASFFGGKYSPMETPYFSGKLENCYRNVYSWDRTWLGSGDFWRIYAIQLPTIPYEHPHNRERTRYFGGWGPRWRRTKLVLPGTEVGILTVVGPNHSKPVENERF